MQDDNVGIRRMHQRIQKRHGHSGRKSGLHSAGNGSNEITYHQNKIRHASPLQPTSTYTPDPVPVQPLPPKRGLVRSYTTATSSSNNKPIAYIHQSTTTPFYFSKTISEDDTADDRIRKRRNFVALSGAITTMSTKLFAINTKTLSPMIELSDISEQNGHDANAKSRLSLHLFLIQISKKLESNSPEDISSPNPLKHFAMSSVDISFNKRILLGNLFSRKASIEDEYILLNVSHMLNITSQNRSWLSMELLVLQILKPFSYGINKEIENSIAPLSYLDAAFLWLTFTSALLDTLGIQLSRTRGFWSNFISRNPHMKSCLERRTSLMDIIRKGQVELLQIDQAILRLRSTCRSYKDGFGIIKAWENNKSQR